MRTTVVLGGALRTFAALSFISPSLVAAATNSSDSSSPKVLTDGYMGLGIAAPAFEKAKAFVSSLTNAEKISIITGGSVDAANSSASSSFTALTSKDGVSGVNFHYFVSGFPMPNALGMTWDVDLFEQQFEAVSAEFYGLGYQVVMSAVAGPLGRTPYGGRTPETFGADPYLAGIAMGRAFMGAGKAGVIATGRHWLLNEQETNRSASMSSSGGGYSSTADDKTIQEVYAWPFADAVREGMMAVMCAMNGVNGTLACEDDRINNAILKEQFGFPGHVRPDVGAQSTSYGSANGGLDYGSSSLWTSEILEAGIANGSFTQKRLDDMVIRNVIGYFHFGMDATPLPSQAGTLEDRNVRGNHSALIRKVGAESLALLKNDNSDGDGKRGLPLRKESVRSVAVFGAHAGPAVAGPNQPFSVQGTNGDVYQGHLVTGGGSGQLSLAYAVTPYHALVERARQDGSMIRWIMNDTYTSTSSSGGFSGGGGGGMPSLGGNATAGNSTGGGGAPGGGGGGGGMGLGGLGQGTAVTPGIANYAGDSDACIVFLNSNSGEGADRSSLSDADQDALVTSVAAACNNTIVVINTAGPRVLADAWVESDNVTAVLYGGLLGQESGAAIVDVLYGDVNPSGKLTHTIARSAEDYPVGVCDTSECVFEEGVFIDYRYFDQNTSSNSSSVRYPFGHGLSYTNFTYDAASLKVAVTDAAALSRRNPVGNLTLGGQADLWDEVVSVSLSVANTGPVAGAEVAQLYLGFPEEAAQPPRVLRGFHKTAVLAAAGSGVEDVTFSLRRRDLSFWDTAAQKWAVAKGTYTVEVGASSRDLRATGQFEV